MNITFLSPSQEFYKAIVSDVKEKNTKYGLYLRIIFSIQEGDLLNYKFSAFIKPTPLRYSNFYNWITNILGEFPPENTFSTDLLIDKKCIVQLKLKNNYYAVADVFSRG
jgi:hypothetical protein